MKTTLQHWIIDKIRNSETRKGENRRDDKTRKETKIIDGTGRRYNTRRDRVNKGDKRREEKRREEKRREEKRREEKRREEKRREETGWGKYKTRQEEVRWEKGKKRQAEQRREKNHIIWDKKGKKKRDKMRMNTLPHFLSVEIESSSSARLVHPFNEWIQTQLIFMQAYSRSQSAAQEVEIDWSWIWGWPLYQPWTTSPQMAAICNRLWTLLS